MASLRHCIVQSTRTKSDQRAYLEGTLDSCAALSAPGIHLGSNFVFALGSFVGRVDNTIGPSLKVGPCVGMHSEQLIFIIIAIVIIIMVPLAVSVLHIKYY